MSNDAQIEAYRKKVEEKRNELGEQPKAHYQTNAVLTIQGTKHNFNLLRTTAACVDVAAQLAAYSNSYDQANKWLGTDVKLELGGYTLEQWIADLKLRTQILEWNVGKAKLDVMDQQLADLLSDDAKTAKAIANIAGELGL